MAWKRHSSSFALAFTFLLIPLHGFILLPKWSIPASHLFRESSTCNVQTSLLASSPGNPSGPKIDDAHVSNSQGHRRPLRRAPINVSPKEQEDEESRQKHAETRHEHALKDPTLLSDSFFNEQPFLAPSIKRALAEKLQVQKMTDVQAKSFAPAFAGENVLARARTGTGKTLAYLLPIIERLLGADAELYTPGSSIGAVIIAPTRELAMQIFTQARELLTYRKDMSVACFFGGTPLTGDYRRLHRALPSILVATPGRFLEHLESTNLGSIKFADIAKETQMIVLDEADRLLDAFRHEINKIQNHLLRWNKRQTLFFSATVTDNMRAFITDSLRINVTEVDCVSESKQGVTPPRETNMRVEQSYLLLDNMDNYVAALDTLIRQATKETRHYKILVFLPTTRLVRFFYHFYTTGLNTPVLELHSLMSQSARQRSSRLFRVSSKAILFSTDVSARGVDYPDVNLVIQFGAPCNAETYIHRLGRTARAGRAGKGIIALLPFESDFLGHLRRRGIKLAELDYLNLGDSGNVKNVRALIQRGHGILKRHGEAACKAFLAYYIENSGLAPAAVFSLARDLARSIGLKTVPPLEPKIAKRMGLKKVLNLS